MIRRCNQSDLLEILSFINEVGDPYEDFYITINNQRLFLKEHLGEYIKYLKKGEVILGDQEKGYIFTWGLSDHSERKYLKIIFKKEEYIKDLLTVFIWNYNFCDWYLKVKKNNPIFKIALSCDFKIIGDRGKEILLKRSKGNERDNKTNQRSDK